jgi:uncharacterized protein YkwD
MRRFAAAPLVSVAALLLGLLLAPPAASAAAHGQPLAQTAGAADASARPAQRTDASRSAAAARRAKKPSAGRKHRRAKPPRVRRCSPAGIRAARGTARMERRVRCILNGRRARIGLPPLRYNRCLDRSAERHARDMVQRRYFAHSSRGGLSLAQRVRLAGYVAGARGWLLGENLAWGAGRRGSAHAAVRGWLHSPPHRRNIYTGGFRDIGVAAVRGAPVKGARVSRDRRPITYVVEFGARSGGRCR